MDKLTPEQIIMIGQWLIFVVVLGVFLWIQYQKDKNVLAAFTKTLTDLQNNPVWLENAKAAGVGIPQDAYIKFYGLIDGLIGLLGKDSEVGKLAAEVKETAELIDHDPANDPPPTLAELLTKGETKG